MAERTIKTKFIVEGRNQAQAEIRAITAYFNQLSKSLRATNENLAQLNKSMKEFIELRKQITESNLF